MNVYDQIRQAADRLVDNILDAMRSMPLNRLLDEAGVKKPTTVARPRKARALSKTPWVLRQREGMPFTVRFTHKGKRVEKSTGTKDRALAEDRARIISLGYLGA